MPYRQLDAILFDLGNTLVSYYAADEFNPILEQSVESIAAVLSTHNRFVQPKAAFETAKLFNHERDDLQVWPLSDRLAQIFGDPSSELPDPLMNEMVDAFLAPIFGTAKLDPQALPVLQRIRELGLKTAIVSNTPWGSPADPWLRELNRLGLTDVVDTVVFCVDTGWRKPAPEPFLEAMSRLDVNGDQTAFVGDDVKWDVEGAKGAGIRPILLSKTFPDSNGIRVIPELGDLIRMFESSS